MFNCALLGNGYDAMCMRERHGGELLWMLNMAVRGWVVFY
jgi:hypothetical protein